MEEGQQQQKQEEERDEVNEVPDATSGAAAEPAPALEASPAPQQSEQEQVAVTQQEEEDSSSSSSRPSAAVVSEEPKKQATPQAQQQQATSTAQEVEAGSGGGWGGGGWGGWWTATSSLVSSVTETASKAANQLADQLNAALLDEVEEEGEDKAKLDTATAGQDGEGVSREDRKGKAKVGDDEDHEDKDTEEDKGFFDYISTVLQQQVEDAEKKATSVIESTMTSLNQFSLEQSVEMGQKWTMQSLDVLEAVGKKAIETLELDEKQIQQSIEQLAPQVEASAEGAKNPAKAVSPPAAASPKPVRNKVVTFESNFEDCYGKAHLEALEHLSASCLMIFCKANPQALKKLSGALKRIEQLFNEDEDDEDEEESKLDAKLLRKLNRKARMKRKIIEKFVAATKQSAQQLIDEFAKQLNTLKAAEGPEEIKKTPEEVYAQTLAQLDKTSKTAMLRLSELSAASVELLLRVAESYLVGVTSPVVVHKESMDVDVQEAQIEGEEEAEDVSADAPTSANDGSDEEKDNINNTPAVVASCLVRDLTQSLEEVTQAFVSTVTGIAKAGKSALQVLPPGENDVSKLSAEIDKKLKALKKEVEAKHGSSAVENVQEARKLFVNISKAVLVSASVQGAVPPTVASSSSSPAPSPSAERRAVEQEAAATASTAEPAEPDAQPVTQPVAEVAKEEEEHATAAQQAEDGGEEQEPANEEEADSDARQPPGGDETPVAADE